MWNLYLSKSFSLWFYNHCNVEEENKLEVGFMHCTKISVLCEPHKLVENPWFVLQIYHMNPVSCSLYHKLKLANHGFIHCRALVGPCVLTVPLGGSVEGREWILCYVGTIQLWNSLWFTVISCICTLGFYYDRKYLCMSGSFFSYIPPKLCEAEVVKT